LGGKNKDKGYWRWWEGDGGWYGLLYDGNNSAIVDEGNSKSQTVPKTTLAGTEPSLYQSKRDQRKIPKQFNNTQIS